LGAAGTPKGAVGARSSADAFEPRWAGEPPLRGGLAPSSPGRPSAPPFRRGVDWGILGNAAGRAVPPRRGWQDLRSVGAAPPKGVGASEAPVVCVLSEASLGSFVFRRASSFRRKASVRIALIPLAGSDLLAAGPKLGCQGPASAPRAPKRRWCVCGSRVGPSSAEAPLVRLRGPLRGLPAHAEACVVDRCGRVVVPLCPKANWIPALRRSAAWGRHRPGAPKCSGLPGAAEAVPGRRVPGCPGPRRRGRRCAEARRLPSPFAGRSPVGEASPSASGREVGEFVPLLTVRRTARGWRRGASRRSGRAEATLRLEEAGIRPERMWSRQRTFRRMACR
jgi:hypothetical protein